MKCRKMMYSMHKRGEFTGVFTVENMFVTSVYEGPMLILLITDITSRMKCCCEWELGSIYIILTFTALVDLLYVIPMRELVVRFTLQ